MIDELPPLPPEGFVWNDPEYGDIPVAYTYEQMKAYARAAIERQSVPADFETAVREYIDDYEMLGETEDGRDACYTPNENDKALLFDAFMGFDFSPWLAAAPQPQPVQKPVKGWWAHTCPEDGKVDVVNYQLTPADKRAGWVEHEVYTSPQAQPLSNADGLQISRALHQHGLTLVRTVQGFGVMKLGEITAYAATKGTT